MANKRTVRHQKNLSSRDLATPKNLTTAQNERLSLLIKRHGFSPTAGDLILINRNWYVTHAGLLQLARRNRCLGIHTETVSEFCDPVAARWMVKGHRIHNTEVKGLCRLW